MRKAVPSDTEIDKVLMELNPRIMRTVAADLHEDSIIHHKDLIPDGKTMTKNGELLIRIAPFNLQVTVPSISKD